MFTDGSGAAVDDDDITGVKPDAKLNNGTEDIA